MNIDHIFIFTDNKAGIADELVSFGLTEGASRIHEGQGTSNRTFVFDNFYLELLWVYSEAEIKSESLMPTGLWTRSLLKENSSSPFGLGIDNTDETNSLFENAFKYQPIYFPAGMTIDILNNDRNFNLPWTFRLPFKRDRQNYSRPPKHWNGINSLTKAEFQFTTINDKKFLNYFENEKTIKFLQANKIWLILTFDNGTQGLTKKFEELMLTINY